MDDFCIYSPQSKHMDKLRLVLERYRLYQITLNPSKYKIMVSHNVVLAHIISKREIAIDQDKVKMIPIHKYLHHRELVQWANLVYEELKKGLKSSRDFISFAPHLTCIVDWCLANPSIHLLKVQHVPRLAFNHEPLRMVEPTLDFNPRGEEDIDISTFLNENIRFADSE